MDGIPGGVGPSGLARPDTDLLEGFDHHVGLSVNDSPIIPNGPTCTGERSEPNGPD